MPGSDNLPPQEFSKSKLKREMLALQEIGKQLIALSPSQLARIPLPDFLLNAIQLAHTLKTGEAKRRHLQYIGKLMREVDCAQIQVALKQTQHVHTQKVNQFHEVEKWRDELIAEGDSGLQKFMLLHPTADRQQLRQLIRKTQQDRAKNINTGSEKELFTCLRTILT